MKKDPNIKFIKLKDFRKSLRSWYKRDFKENLNKVLLKNIVKENVCENKNRISCAIRFIF